jgi:DNA-binding GntR family transcriptional regulator
LQSLDRVCALETELAVLATERMSESQRDELRHLLQINRRAAMVGDIAAILRADRAMDDVLSRASGESEKAAVLHDLKREFKRVWSHTYRFRNVDSFVEQRTTMILAIIAGEREVVSESIRRFFQKLPEHFMDT